MDDRPRRTPVEPDRRVVGLVPPRLDRGQPELFDLYSDCRDGVLRTHGSSGVPLAIFRRSIVAGYRQVTGLTPEIHVCGTADGAGRV